MGTTVPIGAEGVGVSFGAHDDDDLAQRGGLATMAVDGALQPDDAVGDFSHLDLVAREVLGLHLLLLGGGSGGVGQQADE